jgi:hypothetical protein
VAGGGFLFHARKASRFFEIAPVFTRFDQVARIIVAAGNAFQPM